MTAATYDGGGLRSSTTVGGTTSGYVWNTLTAVPEIIMDGANAYIYASGTAPAEQVSLSAGTINYLIADSLGSVRGTVSSSGALTGSATYDAWGNPLTAGGLSSTTPFGYAGGYTDATGLLYLMNRYYDPGTGQFLSVDPKLAETGQPYGYADGNPVSLTDPLGQSFTGVATWGSLCLFGHCAPQGFEWASLYGSGLDVYSAYADWHTGWMDAWSFAVWIHKPGHTFGEWRTPVFGHTVFTGGAWVQIHHTFARSANNSSICVQLWDHDWGQMVAQVCGTMYAS